MTHELSDPWAAALRRAAVVRDATAHRCDHTSDILDPAAMRAARQTPSATRPSSTDATERLRALLAPAPERTAVRDQRVPLKDVATLIGTDSSTVRALIDAGELVAEWERRRRVVPRWAIRAYLSNTNATVCVYCRGGVDGRLESRWLPPTERARPSR